MTRPRWRSRRTFIFAAIGSAVGLGNLWRFPYLAHEFGGGSFLVPYIIALFILGLPLLILEFALGQKSQKGAVEAFAGIHPRWKGVGIMGVFVSGVVVTYYAVIMAWTLYYLLASFTVGDLPWSYNAGDYFFNSVLKVTGKTGVLGGMNWPLVASLALVWGAIYLCIRKGIKSVEKVIVATMPIPLFLLVILFIRGVTLDGAYTGVAQYLHTDLSLLARSDIWLAAASQIFFTLSLGFGVMIAYASFNEGKQGLVGSAFITALSNSAISIFSGFVVFTILGAMAYKTNVPIDEVVASGPGLAFVIFPHALMMIPYGAFFAVLFFMALLTLGIDSAFSLTESINTVLLDKLGKDKEDRVVPIVCVTGFVLGTLFATKGGIYLLEIVDHFITNFTLVFIGIMEALIIGWVYKADKMRDYINSVSFHQIGKSWDIAIKFVIPSLMTLLLINQLIIEVKSNTYADAPLWLLTLGLSVVVIPVLIFLRYAFFFEKSFNINVQPFLEKLPKSLRSISCASIKEKVNACVHKIKKKTQTSSLHKKATVSLDLTQEDETIGIPDGLFEEKSE
ncbi:MAG: sodium-dependent transporter [Alphaproteobacteria bacterium]